MIRVSPKFPCPICGHEDWCLVSQDGLVAICPRTESDKYIENSGYLHRLTEQTKGRRIPYTAIKRGDYFINWEVLNKYYQKGLCPRDNVQRWFGAGFEKDVITYPMRDENLKVIGIQKKAPDRTFMEKGSSLGLFIPYEFHYVGFKTGIVLICEGLSDTMEAVSQKCEAIGRASCNSCQTLIGKYLQCNTFDKPVIIADNDRPGVLGASKLQHHLLTLGIKCMMITPPDGAEDLRDWFKKGLTKQKLYDIIEDNWI